MERFWSKVKRGSGCWEWQAARSPLGYGRFNYGGNRLAHRVAWELENGPVPDGSCVCHSCDNPGCVRPDQLYLGTHADNLRHAGERGLMRPCRGEANGRALLTADDVREIRRLAGPRNQRELGRQFGTSATNIGRIVRRETWAEVV